MATSRITEEHATLHITTILERARLGETFLISANGDQDIVKISRTQAPPEAAEYLEGVLHELKTPAITVSLRAKRLREVLDSGHPAAREALSLAACARRIEQVISNTQLLAKLARGVPIEVNPTRVTRKAVVEMITETTREMEAIASSGRKLQFQVKCDGFDILQRIWVEIDLPLLDQMVLHLLDNAGKYSEDDSVVEVSATLTHQRRYFAISVRNRGRRVTTETAKALFSRGIDERISGGSGLGIYIVSHLLAAHHGRGEVIPTDKNGITEVRLLFPVKQ